MHVKEEINNGTTNSRNTNFKGEDANRFVRKMLEPATKEEIEYKESNSKI